MRRWTGAGDTTRDAPPASLVRRLTEVLASNEPHEGPHERSVSLAGVAGRGTDRDTPDVYLDAAEELLDGLLHEGCSTRERAIDLLTVDALVTYAFEAAAEQPETVADRAREAMLRFGRLAEKR